MQADRQLAAYSAPGAMSSVLFLTRPSLKPRLRQERGLVLVPDLSTNFARLREIAEHAE